MAITTTRLCVTNRIKATSTVLSASSALTAQPVSWLKDPLRQKRWRSASGWTIAASFNGVIDFNRGGVKNAVLTTTNYATGALMAAQIVVALEAADAVPVWACTYDAGTHKFTISSDLAFTLLWASGANAYQSPAIDLGFAVADTASAVSHTSANAVYQSRHWIVADLGSALTVRAAQAHDHNFTSAASVSIYGNGSDTWTSPTFGDFLALNTDENRPALVYFAAEQTQRYWRLRIADCGNSDGFAELGIWFAGPYVQPTITYSSDFVRSIEGLSDVVVTPGGAHWVNQRPMRPAWSMAWSEIPEADRALLAGVLEAAPKGECLFISFDAVTTPLYTEYVWLANGWQEGLTAGAYFDVKIPALYRAL
jgi:hypothetical protein